MHCTPLLRTKNAQARRHRNNNNNNYNPFHLSVPKLKLVLPTTFCRRLNIIIPVSQRTGLWSAEVRWFAQSCLISRGFWGGAVVKNPPANAGDPRDTSWIPGSGRSPGGENGNPFQYSCLENSMDSRAWWSPVHGVAKSQTWLSFHVHLVNKWYS